MRKLALVLCVLLLCLPGAAKADSTLKLHNGDFSIVYDNSVLPDGWFYDAWDATGAEAYLEEHQSGGNAVVLHSFAENDARVCQTIDVEPNTCYRFTCELSVEQIDGEGGANLSVLDTYAVSDAFYRTDGWQSVSVTGITGSEQTELTVALRLGEYGAVSVGTVRFRNVVMERLSTAPEGALSFVPIGTQAGTETEGTTEPETVTYWGAVIAVSIGFLALGLLLYRFCLLRPSAVRASMWDTRVAMLMMFMLAVLIRAVLSLIFVGHSTDIGCFIAWAEAMAEYGPGGFYTSGMFADYPPGYMYVLWACGALRRLIGVGYNSAIFVLLLKLPSIVADLVLGYVVYRYARAAKLSNRVAGMLLCIVAFHPVFMFISGAWGQIDSILTLFLVATMLLLLRDQRVLAGAVFGLAILLKPQALMLGPLLAAVYLWPHANERYYKTFYKAVISVVAALAVILLLSLPFSNGLKPDWLLEKYFSTATGYPYASVEAFNLAAFLGGNWAPVGETVFLFSYGVWGTIGIVVSVIAAIWLYGKGRAGNEAGAMFLSAAFLFVSLFMLGTFMHERYLYPALIPLLLAAIAYNDRRLYISFIWLSFTLLFNSLCAFVIVGHPEARTDIYHAMTHVCSFLNLLALGHLWLACRAIVWRGEVQPACVLLAEDEAQTENQKHEQGADHS